MFLVLLGPPGAGKGSQAELIAREYHLPHISTGDMFRTAVKEGTPLGTRAQQYMEQGLLVPDEVTNGIVADRLNQADARRGFLLDGYPRTVDQARFLDGILASDGRSLSVVLDIEAPDEVIIRRLSGRRVCRGCAAVYHTQTKPSAMGNLCELCRGELVQRTDDREETVHERLRVYRLQTEPLVDFYRSRGLLRSVDGDRSISAVFEDVRGILGSLGASV